MQYYFKTWLRYLVFLYSLFVTAYACAKVTKKDAFGREVELLKAPQRIVSGSLASDEIILELLKDPKDLGRVAALSYLVDDSRYSNCVTQARGVKGRFWGDVESSMSFSPDLVVLASFQRPEVLRRFQGLSIPAYVIADIRDFSELQLHIDTLGELLFVKSKSDAMNKNLREDLKKLEDGARIYRDRKPRVLHVYPDGVISGQGTMVHAVIVAAGAKNAVDGILEGWKKLSEEVLMTLEIDLILLGAEDAAEIKVIPGFSRVRAAKNAKVFAVPSAELSALSQHVVKAAQKLQKELLRRYPTGIAP